MQEYFKVILQKVSFDQELFEKELNKAISSLMSHELPHFENWCYQQFGHRYMKVLQQCFNEYTYQVA